MEKENLDEQEANGIKPNVMLSLLAKIDEEINSYQNFRDRSKAGHYNDSVSVNYANEEIKMTGREQADNDWFQAQNALRRAKTIIKEYFANNGA